VRLGIRISRKQELFLLFSLEILWQCLNAVIVKVRVLTPISEQVRNRRRVRCAKGEKKTLFQIRQPFVRYAKETETTRAIEPYRIHFVRAKV
jgi:hypothetical protein